MHWTWNAIFAATFLAGPAILAEDAEPVVDAEAMQALEERLQKEPAKAAEGKGKREGKAKDALGGGDGEMRQKLLEKFDANSDGRIDPDEMEKAKEDFARNHPKLAERQQKMLEKFDADGNGYLDEEERAKAAAAAKDALAEGGDRLHKQILARFDANKDGKLDEAEREKAKEAFLNLRERAGKGAGREGKRPTKEEEGKGVSELSDREREAALKEFEELFGK